MHEARSSSGARTKGEVRALEDEGLAARAADKRVAQLDVREGRAPLRVGSAGLVGRARAEEVDHAKAAGDVARVAPLDTAKACVDPPRS